MTDYESDRVSDLIDAALEPDGVIVSTLRECAADGWIYLRLFSDRTTLQVSLGEPAARALVVALERHLKRLEDEGPP